MPYFPQETRVSCTVACLRMVLSHWGINEDEPKLRDGCKTTHQGTRASDVVACAREYGLQAGEYRDTGLEDISGWLSQNIYPILLINLFPLNALWVTHAVVVIEINDDFISYLDPIFGQKSASFSVFEQAWRMNRRRAIVIWQ